jgi:hypothetical protein
MMQGLQQSGAEAQAGLAAANSKAASGGKALSQAQQELHQMHDAYRSERPNTTCDLRDADIAWSPHDDEFTGSAS